MEDTVLSRVSHESRNALQELRVGLELLRAEVEDRPSALELVEQVQSTEERIARLFEALQRCAAPLRPASRDVPLEAVWRAAWRHLASRRERRNVRLEEAAGSAGVRGRLDPSLAEDALVELLSRALQVCGEPGTIRVSCAGREIEGRRSVAVAVRDSGPLLSAEDRACILEPLEAARGALLGARRIAEAHGGKVVVDSPPREEPDGWGTEVTLLFPV